MERRDKRATVGTQEVPRQAEAVLLFRHRTVVTGTECRAAGVLVMVFPTLVGSTGVDIHQA